MKLPFSSFRSKIALTLIAVIALFSSAAFYLYNAKLTEKIYVNKETGISSMLTLLKDQFYFTINIHDGRIIKSMVSNIRENRMVLNAYLVNANGDVTFPKKYKLLMSDTLDLKNKAIPTDSITIKRYNRHIMPFSRAFIPLKNTHKCFRCHAPSKKNLGFIIIDLSNKDTEKNVAFTRKFSIIFTLLMVLIISVFVFFMHYKFVRRSLLKFQNSIAKINKGNLDERLIIHDTKELGNLAESFNNMLEKFQKAQQELKIYNEKELTNAQKLATVGEMAARLAHEIRNPMTGISNSIEIIISETTEKEHIPIFEEIIRQANRVNNAISDLLKFSKSQAIILQKSNIEELVNNVVFFLEKHAQYKDIAIKTVSDKNISEFQFDPLQMENVLMNLALNAIQAMQYSGNLTFSILFDNTDEFVIISVSDNGPGISNAKLAEIFKPFFTTRTEGTGLGLAIVKEIVEKHKGYIKVNNNKDKGCTFSVYLPIIKNTELDIII